MKEGFEPKKISPEAAGELATSGEQSSQTEQELFENQLEDIEALLDEGMAIEFISTYPKEVLMHPKAQALALSRLRDSFSNSDYYLANKIFALFGFSDAIIEEPKMKRAVIDGLVEALKNDYFTAIELLTNYFGPSPEILFSDEVQSVIKTKLKHKLETANIDEVNKFITDLIIFENIFNDPDIKQAIQTSIIEWLSNLSRGDVSEIQRLIDRSNIPIELLQTKRIKAAAKIAIGALVEKDFDNLEINQLIGIFDLSAEEVKIEVLRSIYSNTHNPKQVEKIKSAFGYTTEELSEPGLQRLAQDNIRDCILFNKFAVAQNIKKVFGVSEDAFDKILLNIILAAFKSDEMVKTLQMLKAFDLSEELLNNKILRGSVLDLLREQISEGAAVWALELIKLFKITEQELSSLKEDQKALEAGLVGAIVNDDVIDIQAYIATFDLSDTFLKSTEVDRETRKRIITLLKEGELVEVEKLAEIMNQPIEVVKNGAARVLSGAIDEGNLSLAAKLIRRYKFENGSKRLQEALLAHGLDISTEELMSIAEDDRFGIHLLTKFPSFDRRAKEAVMQILKCDEETPKEIDRRSLEYRKVVQEKLSEYKNNKHISEALIASGVDLETWLNYDQVDYFTLGEADELTTAEQIKTPIERLVPSFEAFTKAMKETIGEYRKELFNIRVPVDTNELLAKKVELEGSIKTTRDANKRSGMEKGLAVLNEQIANPKTVLVWEKVMAEFSKLIKLAEGITAKNTELDALEKNKITITDENSLKAAQENKANTWKTRKSLVKELSQLKRRSGEIFETLEQSLVPAIGSERASGIKQEVHSKVREHIDHLGTDFDTIFSFIDVDEENISTNEVDDEEVEDDTAYRFNPSHAKQLQGRPMSIRVGGRSRQDLYLGNYTTCCIRIDSDFHGAESPIADYVTDLGMQNVIIYDEAAQTPIACAWCWIGRHNATNETALVIDNVEGWQKFTVNFQNQLNEQLATYLESYADAIKVKNLTQGPDYNDLNPVSEYRQGEWYLKLGGSNRPDEPNGTCGYYLEAEHDSYNGDVDWD